MSRRGAAVTVSGVRATQQRIAKIRGALPQDIRYGLERAGAVIEGPAKENCAVDTGRLRGSITVEVVEESPTRMSVAVGTNLDYAADVEYGTGKYAENGQGRKTPWVYKDPTGKTDKKGRPVWIWTEGNVPQPFLRPAWDECKEDAAAELVGATQDSIRRRT